uniref:Uncharacterized protein n=1 Tax=Oryza glaberrima TaxID=4538 RepID=I1QH20_ORYGL
MKKGFLALSLFLLLTLASQATWCDAERSHAINGARLRPHLQFEELHVTDGKKLGQAADTDTDTDTDSHKHHDEVKVPMRMVIAHKGGGDAGSGEGDGVRPGTGLRMCHCSLGFQLLIEAVCVWWYSCKKGRSIILVYVCLVVW